MSDDVVGPIDSVLLEFGADQSLDEVAGSLSGLIDLGLIRLYDIVAVRKDVDGSVTGIKIADVAGGDGMAGLGGARSGLLDADDVVSAGAVMDPGTIAVLLLYENAWAVPVVAATRRAGGEVTAIAHVTGQQVTDALDALERRG